VTLIDKSQILNYMIF